MAADAVDVCVVGSGAGGGAVALALANAGLSVVVLEKGPWRTRASFTHDELAMVRRDFFLPFAADEARLVRADDTTEGRPSTFGGISSVVGGGTVHWAGYAYRFHPDELRRGTLEGTGALADWPFDYEALEPWYARAEALLGVAGLAVEGPHEPPRSGPFPLAPILVHPFADELDRRLAAAGVTTTVTPRAILTEARGDRAACVYCRHCSGYGCEVGAKGSSLEAFLPAALRTGRCRVVAGVLAHRIEQDRRGRASRVLFRGERGEEHAQVARVVVVAGSAVETPRLLLASDGPLAPHGLANGSGLVGRHLMLLTLGRASAVVPGVPEDPAPFLGRTVREKRARGGTISLERASENAIGIAERLALESGPRPLWGAALKAKLLAWADEGFHLEAECFTETLPRPENRVELVERRDRWGARVARITFAPARRDVEASASIVEEAATLLAAAGGTRVERRTIGGTFDVIQSGTCRAGLDPSRSVLDRDCRAHEVDNLYVVDGSFQPTSGGVPNTLTIVANALRVGEAIAARARRGELPAPA